MIIIDTREDQPLIRKTIASLDCGFPDHKIEKLDLADFLLQNEGESMLIERKNIADFANSYVELKSRMDKMRERFDRTALIIEGNWINKGGYIHLWRGNQLCKAMLESTFYNYKLSQQERGSYFDVTRDLSETLRLVRYWHDYLPRAGKSPVRKSKNAVEWFAQLPGLGLLRAFDLRSKYETPRHALTNMDEWMPSKAKPTIDRW